MGVAITRAPVISPIGSVVAWLKSLLPTDTLDKTGPYTATAPADEEGWLELFSFTGQDLIDEGLIEGVDIYWDFELKKVHVLGNTAARSGTIAMVMDSVTESIFETTSEDWVNFSHTITAVWDAETEFVAYGWSDRIPATCHDTSNQNNTFGYFTITLDDHWVECNGQTLDDSESVYDGLDIPDLNGYSGTERFLRGQTSSGGTGGSETHKHSVGQTAANDPYQASSKNNVAFTGNFSTLPSYYEVVWVMRIK